MTSLLNIAGNIPVSAAAVGGQSLRFEDGDSPSFSFTFGTPTNQIKWTMSFWCKRGEIGREHAIYGAANGGGETFFVAFYPDDIEAYISNGRNHVTNAVFRDPSAWYHIVQVFDSANATADDRFITYVNGVRQTTSTNSVALNDTTGWNTSGITGYFGKNYGAWFGDSRDHFDGYLANVTFIDGQALDPTSFGEYDDTLWKPKSDADITSLTFGTNGFYLPFKQTTEAEGFSTVTYTGNGSTQSIEGVGFEPDFVWIKNRDTNYQHQGYDSVRGATKKLLVSDTDSEATDTNGLTSFDSSGFSLGSNVGVNESGKKHVAWCWDAGSGSAVSNTDGSIPSTVKANTAKGFSIISFVGNATAGATVGHGLTSTPEVVISKNRDDTNNWLVYHKDLDASNPEQKRIFLNLSDAVSDSTTPWNDTAPTSSLLTLGTSGYTNGSSDDMIMYAFHSVSGYSKISSYSGTGSTGNAVTGLGFEPAWLMIKRYDGGTNGWMIYDNTRDVDDDRTARLKANASDAEDTGDAVSFDSDGFTLNATGASVNGSSNDYIYMAFADTRDATFFGDTSGNGNNWTPNALNNTDVVPDSPVTGGNFATLNPLDAAGISSNFYLSEGNLAYSVTNNSSYRNASSTFFPEGLKGYYEFSITTGTPNFYIGMYPATSNPSANLYTTTNTIQLNNDGTLYNGSTTLISSMLSSFSAGDVGMIAFDFTGSSKYIWFGKNGSWGIDGSSNTQDPAGGNNPAHTFTTEQQLYFASNTGSGTQTIIANFGQDSSFAGNKTPQGNTDDNGVGDFYYAPPSGFLALTTGNLPTPDITAPDEYFNTVLYTGTGASNSVTGVGFQPDWVWIKRRSAAAAHALWDNVRGTQKWLLSDGTNAEITTTDGLSSFDSDGFTLGADATYGSWNNSGTHVAWNWKAGGTAVTNTDGDISSQVSANTDAGFSIVSWTSDGSTDNRVGHGLSSAPELIIYKVRTGGTSNWNMWTTVIDGSDDVLFWNLTAAGQNVPASHTSPTATTISNYGYTNGNTMIAYCFHSVEGFSKVGTYESNNSTDGRFVHTGFAPAWVQTKDFDRAAMVWGMFDNKRETFNVRENMMTMTSAAEPYATQSDIDFLSNGFKFRNGSTSWNNYLTETYFYWAFAEAPFKKSNAK